MNCKHSQQPRSLQHILLTLVLSFVFLVASAATNLGVSVVPSWCFVSKNGFLGVSTWVERLLNSPQWTSSNEVRQPGSWPKAPRGVDRLMFVEGVR